MALRAREVLESPGGSALVPALWWFEVRNILIVNERRGRILADATTDFLNQLDAMDIRTMPPAADTVVLGLARDKRLSVYDAAYLAVAVQHHIPLATLDSALQSAAKSINVSLLV